MKSTVSFKKLKDKKKSKPIKENDGFASELGEQDEQKQKEALNVSTNPVAEGNVRILTFEQFINEAEDFQSQYMPQYNPDSTTDDEDDIDAGVPAAEEPNDDSEEPETEDSWNAPEGDDGSSEDDWDADYTGSDSPEKGDDVTTTKNQVSALTDQITDILNQYKAGSLTIEQYKEKASPLLAQRKELQAKLDQAFNMSMAGVGIGAEEEDDEI